MNSMNLWNDDDDDDEDWRGDGGTGVKVPRQS